MRKSEIEIISANEINIMTYEFARPRDSSIIISGISGQSHEISPAVIKVLPRKNHGTFLNDGIIKRPIVYPNKPIATGSMRPTVSNTTIETRDYIKPNT